MTVKNHPCRPSLSSLSTVSSTASSSIFLFTYFSSISRRLFTETSENRWKFFFNFRSVVSTLNFQSFGLNTSIVVSTLNLIVVPILNFQSFGFWVSKVVSTINLAIFSTFLFAVSLGNWIPPKSWIYSIPVS